MLRRGQNSSKRRARDYKSDLLVINKIDLAPFVGADLGVMERDAKKMRGNKPFIFTNLKENQGLSGIIDFVKHHLV